MTSKYAYTGIALEDGALYVAGYDLGDGSYDYAELCEYSAVDDEMYPYSIIGAFGEYPEPLDFAPDTFVKQL